MLKSHGIGGTGSVGDRLALATKYLVSSSIKAEYFSWKGSIQDILLRVECLILIHELMNLLAVEHHHGCFFEEVHFNFAWLYSKVRPFGIYFIASSKFSIYEDR